MDNEQLDALERIAELKQRGILTDAEVQTQKRQILSASLGAEDLDPTADSGPRTTAGPSGAPKAHRNRPNRRVFALLAAVTAAIILFFVLLRDDPKGPTATSVQTTTTRQQVIPTTTSVRTTTTRQQVIPTTTSVRTTTTRQQVTTTVFDEQAELLSLRSRIGKGSFSDSYFIEAARKFIPLRASAATEDWQIFEHALLVCSATVVDRGIETLTRDLEEAIRTMRLEDFGARYGSSIAALTFYCPDYLDEFTAWAEEFEARHEGFG